MASLPSAPMKSPAENTLTPETFRLVATTLPLYAAAHGNAGLFRQRDIRPDARRENHRVGIDPAPVGQFDALDAPLAMKARGVGIQQDLDALAFDDGFQQF